MEDKGTPHVVIGSSSPHEGEDCSMSSRDTWHWVLLYIGHVFAVVPLQQDIKSRVSCHLPGNITEDELCLECKARDPKGWSVGKSKLAKNGVFRLSQPMFCK